MLLYWNFISISSGFQTLLLSREKEKEGLPLFCTALLKISPRRVDASRHGACSPEHCSDLYGHVSKQTACMHSSSRCLILIQKLNTQQQIRTHLTHKLHFTFVHTGVHFYALEAPSRIQRLKSQQLHQELPVLWAAPHHQQVHAELLSRISQQPRARDAQMFSFSAVPECFSLPHLWTYTHRPQPLSLAQASPFLLPSPFCPANEKGHI